MSENKSLINPRDLLSQLMGEYSIEVPSVDGSSNVTLSPGAGLLDYSGGTDSTPIGRLKVITETVTVPSGRTSVQANVQKIGYQARLRREDGQWENQIVAKFEVSDAEPLIVYPVGILPSHYNRVLMTPFQAGGNSARLCHSEGGIYPDAEYRGKEYNGVKFTQCCAIDPATNRIVDVCPFAQWGAKVDGKAKPPACTKQFVVAVAFSLPGTNGNTMEIAEVVFQKTGAKDGRDIVSALAYAIQNGTPLQMMSIHLAIKAEGVGHRLSGQLCPAAVAFSEEDNAAFHFLQQRWVKALQYRTKRAQSSPPSEEVSEPQF